MRKASRLVAMMVVPGQRLTIVSVSFATSPTTCSQLSRISSNCLVPMARATDLCRDLFAFQFDAEYARNGRRYEFGIGKRGQFDRATGQPSGGLSGALAACSASAVLPIPPGPTRARPR